MQCVVDIRIEMDLQWRLKSFCLKRSIHVFLVLLDEQVSAILRGAKGGLDRIGTIEVIALNINV